MLLLLVVVVLMWYVDVLWEGTWRSLSCRCTQWKVTKRSSMLLMVLVDWVLVKVLQSLSQQDEMVGSSTLYILMILVSLAALHSHHLCQPCCSTFSSSLSALLLYILVILVSLAALHSHDPCQPCCCTFSSSLSHLAALHSHHPCQPCCSTFSSSLSALLLYILIILVSLAAVHSHHPCQPCCSTVICPLCLYIVTKNSDATFFNCVHL